MKALQFDSDTNTRLCITSMISINKSVVRQHPRAHWLPVICQKSSQFLFRYKT